MPGQVSFDGLRACSRESGASTDDYVTEYEWDHRNRLTQVTFKNNSLAVTKAVSYNYDYLNRRVHREVGSDDSYYVYDGTDVVLEFDGAEGDDVSHRYLHGPAVDQVLAGEQVSSLDTPGDVLWSLSDNLGTVRDLVEYNSGTDTTTVANHLEYDAYGNIISETNAAVDFLYAFTGREWDAETQLQNNLNRWYDPTIGRWLSEDPIGFGASDANLYRYVSNSPSTASDPIGLEPITPQTRPWRYGALAQAQVGAWKGPFPSTTPGKVFVKPWSFLAELGDDQLDATKARGCYDLAGKRFGVFPTDAKGKITTTEYGQFPIHADGARVFSTIQGAFAYANQLVGDGKRARIYAAQMGAALKAAPTGWTPQYPQFGEVHRSQFRKVGFNFASLHWTPTQSWEWEWVSSGGRRGDPKRSAGLPNKTTTIFGVVEITPQREKVACGLPNTPWEQSTGQSKSPEWGRFHFLP